MTISILGGSCDLVSKVISTSMGVISIVTLIISLVGPSYYPFKYLYTCAFSPGGVCRPVHDDTIQWGIVLPLDVATRRKKPALLARLR